MIRDFYSNEEFNDLKQRLNQEIQRRGTFTWWDPLTTPAVGQDRSAPLTIHNRTEEGIRVDEKTYTINNPSEGSVERTRNADYPAQGENPGGELPDDTTTIPTSSAAQINVDEMRNFLVGLAKIQDINLFYGRDEIEHLAFRDPQGIEDALEAAEASELNRSLAESAISPSKVDPNDGIVDHRSPEWGKRTIIKTYPIENEQYVMPSGERDGEELETHDGVGPTNFFDDYGANPGDSQFRPYNRHTTPVFRRDRDDQGRDRKDPPTVVREGGIPSSVYGVNPRNPSAGKPLPSRPAYGGVPGSCQVACTGMCYQTCDNECSESCTTTCWNRCGNACTASCGNVCTGCTTMCYTSCKTKCENSTGYACVKAGAQAVEVVAAGGSNGVPAENKLIVQTYTCNGCSYSCQFYPNKKTECWDAACMGKCFITCNTACSTSCFGGCVDNDKTQGRDYKSGTGKGCSGGCTLNCIGQCSGTCEGYCIQTCWKACKQQCTDNCSWLCETNCGTGCANRCKLACTGCSSCTGNCEGQTYSRGCLHCGIEGGCTASCQHDCNKNCMGWGCRSICGVDAAGACEANCRLNCMGTSCTAMCSDACSSECTTCVNTCGFQCGACSSMCSTGCGAECNITCTEECKQSCNENCVMSCTETCGGCSNLCYSCVGMCIGVCSQKCEDGCSCCANLCGWWCDSTCSRDCFSNCSTFCIDTCSASCISFLSSQTSSKLPGPIRTPTSDGYIYKFPKNRWEERESFKVIRKIAPYLPEYKEPEFIIKVDFDEDRNLEITAPEGIEWVIYQSTINGGVYSIDDNTGEIVVNESMLTECPEVNHPNYNDANGIYVIRFFYNHEVQYTKDDILVKVPFGFDVQIIKGDTESDAYVIIEVDPFLLHGRGGGF